MQQAVGFDDVAHVGSRAPDGVNQPAVGIHTDVGLHPEVPLVAFLGRSWLRHIASHHFQIALAASLLGGVGGSNQRGVRHGVRLQQQTLGLRHLVEGSQNLFSQLVLLEQVTKLHDRALVG